MPRKPIERLKGHAVNHPELVTHAQIKTEVHGVVYYLDPDGYWYMQPATDSTWPQTPMRVTDPHHIKRIEDTLDPPQ